ncbi:MAG: hypothetical protein IJJ33_05960 [Victivallales bacterium]|nr:hypothetical protein [Victivallales bacterium]
MKISLDGHWKVIGYSPEGKTLELDGLVPGCVHTDLLNAGLLPDLFWRDNAERTRWVETWNWAYEREFTAPAVSPGATLEFEGLDTYCTVCLNGQVVGKADNMFLPHSFPARGLKEGANTIRLVFHSPITATNGLPSRPAAFTAERLYTRRLQCTYSWDWVDRFVTMGCFRHVCLHLPERREIADLNVETRAVDGFGALLHCRVAFIGTATDVFCHLTLIAPDGTQVLSKRRRVVEESMTEWLDVENPSLWWPNGYGEQPLYRLTAQLETESGDTLESKSLAVGIRTIRIVQHRDKPGSASFERCQQLKQKPHVSGERAFWDRNREDEFSSFTLLVNGVPIFCKGANWVPCEPFPSQETPTKIRCLLEMTRQANANMIRIWGGGLFEQDFFYDECDRLGLLVTQDFLMACGSYPEDDEDFLRQLSLEAEHACRRLRNHACLAWWSGDNENGMGADEDMVVYGGRRAAMRTIAPIIERLDPNRPFLPSSPYKGRPFGSITCGTTHNTNYIGEWFSYIRHHDMTDYRSYFENYLSRFCAEGPIMGFDRPSSLHRFMTEEDIYGEDDSMLRFHTKNNPSEVFREFQIYDYLCAIADKLLGTGACAQDRILKRQYVQYEWIRITMEQYRREKWFSSGMIYWMLDDIWPANGWAIVDYYARPKAAWYALRRACARVVASIGKGEGDVVRLFVCVDGRAPAAGKARLFLQPFDSPTPLWSREADYHVEANSSQVVLEVAPPPVGAEAILVAEIAGEDYHDRAWLFESRPQDCRFPGVAPKVVAADEASITLQATQYVHAVELDGDCFFEDNFFSMLPGETRVIHYRREGEGAISLRALNSALPSTIIPSQKNPSGGGIL